MQQYELLIPKLNDILLDLQVETEYIKNITVGDTHNLMITCPNHKGGQEDTPSCGVNIDTGVVHCLTCGWKGNLISLTNKCRDIEDGYNYLISRYITEEDIYARKKANLVFSRGASSNVIIEDFPSALHYPQAVEYLKGRGLGVNIIEKFDIRYDENRQMIQIPIYKGKHIVGFKGRKIVKVDKKFRFFNTPNMEKVLFCLDKIQNGNYVFVTEAEIDCLTFWSWGKEAISILGSKMTDNQLSQLAKSNIKSIVIALDNDDIGRLATIQLLEMVKDLELDIYILDYKNTNKKDANDFDSFEEFRSHIKLSKVTNRAKLC